MARPVGFEPTNAGTKTQCLTTWRRPNTTYFTTHSPKLKI